jgi:hypothetical protein
MSEETQHPQDSALPPEEGGSSSSHALGKVGSDKELSKSQA